MAGAGPRGAGPAREAGPEPGVRAQGFRWEARKIALEEEARSFAMEVQWHLLPELTLGDEQDVASISAVPLTTMGSR